MNSSLVIRNGRILAPEGFVESDLAVEDGRITEQLQTRADMGIDGEGLLVAPGLIDIQINGGFGLDFSADPTAIWEVGARLPTTGVTSFLPTIITSPPERRMKALQVIGEGVETEEQADALLGLGCELAQGFLFSPAIAPAAIARLPNEHGGRLDPHRPDDH